MRWSKEKLRSGTGTGLGEVDAGVRMLDAAVGEVLEAQAEVVAPRSPKRMPAPMWSPNWKVLLKARSRPGEFVLGDQVEADRAFDR